MLLPKTDKSPGLPRETPSATVLVVEDEPSLHRAYRRHLTHMGFGVLSAYTGGQALIAVRQHHQQIHLMLLDMMLPDMDGDQLLQRLSQEALIPSIPVIAVTAGAWNAAELEEMHRFGVCEYFQKHTLSLETLSVGVAYHLERVRHAAPVAWPLFYFTHIHRT